MTKRTSYTVAELAEVAAGIRRLLGAVEAGDLTADAGTVARLEGAAAVLDALSADQRPARVIFDHSE